MTRSKLQAAVWILTLSVTLACGPEQRPEIFDEVNRAATGVMSATSVGVNYQKLGELVIALATETDLAKQKAKHPAELAVVTSLESAMDAYRDSLSVWKLRIEHGSMLTKYDGMAPYAKKYDVPSRSASRDDLWDAEATMRLAWVVGEEHLQNAQKQISAMR